MLVVGNNVSAEKLRLTDGIRTEERQIAANFPFDPPILIELLDEKGNLINSNVDVTAKVLPQEWVPESTTYCISNEKFLIKGGKGIFPGSFCNLPKTKVFLFFTAKTNRSVFLHTELTKPIVVTNDVHIAYFRPTWIEKLLNDQLEDFMKYSVDMINRNRFGGYPYHNQLMGRQIKLTTYSYDTSDVNAAKNQYSRMLRINSQSPHEKAYAVIGLDDDAVSQEILPSLMKQELAVTSFRKDFGHKLSNKHSFAYLNRLQTTTHQFLDNVFLYLGKRMWTSIVIIYTTGDDFSDVLWEDFAEKYETNIIKYKISGNMKVGEEKNLDVMFKDIRNWGYRIILTTATGNTAKNLFKQADRNKITSKNAFQWIGLKNEKDLKFLSTNSQDWCIKEIGESVKLCVEEFKGMIVINNVYYNGLNSSQSSFMWRGFMEEKPVAPRAYVQPADYYENGVHYALAYDALKVNIMALHRLIYARKTINGVSLSREIRESTDFMGMSGKVSFDKNGYRNMFIGSVSTLWPIMGHIRKSIDITSREQWMSRCDNDWINVLLFKRKRQSFVEMHLISNYSRTLGKHSSSDDYLGMFNCRIEKDNWFKSNHQSHARNKIIYEKCEGVFNPDDGSFVAGTLENCNEKILSKFELAPFSCMGGCGGKQHSNVYKYENGACVKHDVCKCKTGWSGSHCIYRNSIAPETRKYYTKCNGTICHQPIRKSIVPERVKYYTKCNGTICHQPIYSTCGLELNEANYSCSYDKSGRCRIGGPCAKPDVCICDADNYNGTVGRGYTDEDDKQEYLAVVGDIITSIIKTLIIFILITTLGLEAAVLINDINAPWGEEDDKNIRRINKLSTIIETKRGVGCKNVATIKYSMECEELTSNITFELLCWELPWDCKFRLLDSVCIVLQFLNKFVINKGYGHLVYPKRLIDNSQYRTYSSCYLDQSESNRITCSENVVKLFCTTVFSFVLFRNRKNFEAKIQLGTAICNDKNKYNTMFLIRTLHNEIHNICINDNPVVTQDSINVCKGALGMMNPCVKACVVDKLTNAVEKRLKQLKITENIVPKSLPQSVVGNPNIWCKTVGFRYIGKYGAPVVVVACLGDMHSLCNFVKSSKFNVYKIEKINDKYMIVSGICEWSENMTNAIGSLEFPHNADNKLQFRSGVYTENVRKITDWFCRNSLMLTASKMPFSRKSSRVEINGGGMNNSQ